MRRLREARKVTAVVPVNERKTFIVAYTEFLCIVLGVIYHIITFLQSLSFKNILQRRDLKIVRKLLHEATAFIVKVRHARKVAIEWILS